MGLLVIVVVVVVHLILLQLGQLHLVVLQVLQVSLVLVVCGNIVIIIIVDNIIIIIVVAIVHLLLAVGGGQPLPGQRIDEQRVLLQVLLQRILLRQDARRVRRDVVVRDLQTAHKVPDYLLLLLMILRGQRSIRQIVARSQVVGRGGRGHGCSLLQVNHRILAVLDIVQVLIGAEVVQREVGTGRVTQRSAHSHAQASVANAAAPSQALLGRAAAAAMVRVPMMGLVVVPWVMRRVHGATFPRRKAEHCSHLGRLQFRIDSST